ncbi:Pectinesterase, catalytic [Dillenia turbinata]|uniref:Pectinesterase, catalytic n=1 Tax=Dillenia turbinata TaxID=194707 RepID=A0AAN8VCY6_9MAGN
MSLALSMPGLRIEIYGRGRRILFVELVAEKKRGGELENHLSSSDCNGERRREEENPETISRHQIVVGFTIGCRGEERRKPKIHLSSSDYSVGYGGEPGNHLSLLDCSGEAYLGRPWKPYSRSIIMQSYIHEFINPKSWLEGFNDMATNKNVRGPGSRTDSRVKNDKALELVVSVIWLEQELHYLKAASSFSYQC